MKIATFNIKSVDKRLRNLQGWLAKAQHVAAGTQEPSRGIMAVAP
ncbi:hypothetical protein [Falsiroseomonas sp. HW251]